MIKMNYRDTILLYLLHHWKRNGRLGSFQDRQRSITHNLSSNANLLPDNFKTQ